MTTDIKTRAREAQEAGIIIMDGHTLFDAEYYSPHFTVEELTEAGLIETHKSDKSSWKSTMYDTDGNVIEELTAVYHLNFLYWLARQVGADSYPRAMGRGSQAQELVGNIRQALAD